MRIFNKKAFTLVELIIVITILGILSTIGILKFGSYNKDARDTARISDLQNIKKALDLYDIKNFSFPEHDINSSGEKIFGETAFNKLTSLVTFPKDPKTNKEYGYEKIGNGYIIKSQLENGKEEIITGGELPTTCKEYLQIDNSYRNGNYQIFPRNKKIDVYCDMETPDENGDKGWTRYVNIKGNYSFDDAKKCWLGDLISNNKIDCFNPNRFEMSAEKFMAKQDGQIYFYNNLNPEPKVNFVTTDTHKCIGGINYMTILTWGIEENTNIENANHIRLGLSFCKYGWQLGGISSSVTSGPYFNKSSDERGFQTISNGFAEANAKLTEIYIK